MTDLMVTSALRAKATVVVVCHLCRVATDVGARRSVPPEAFRSSCRSR